MPISYNLADGDRLDKEVTPLEPGTHQVTVGEVLYMDPGWYLFAADVIFRTQGGWIVKATEHRNLKDSRYNILAGMRLRLVVSPERVLTECVILGQSR